MAERWSQSDGLILRVAVSSDIGAVMEVQRRSPGRSTSAEFREHTLRSIEDGSLLFLVATVADEVIGWAMTKHFAEPDGPAPAGHYLMGITVAADARRRGVGTALIQARLDWIGQRASSAYFFASTQNLASIAAHERFGFSEIARGTGFRGISFESGAGILFAAELRCAAGVQAERLT